MSIRILLRGSYLNRPNAFFSLGTHNIRPHSGICVFVLFLRLPVRGTIPVSLLVITLEGDAIFGRPGGPVVSGFQERRRYFGEHWKNGLWITV